MIERQYGMVVFICDECGDEYVTNERDLDRALSRMQDDERGCDWVHMQDDHSGEWVHYCEDCASRL